MSKLASGKLALVSVTRAKMSPPLESVISFRHLTITLVPRSPYSCLYFLATVAVTIRFSLDIDRLPRASTVKVFKLRISFSIDLNDLTISSNCWEFCLSSDNAFGQKVNKKSLQKVYKKSTKSQQKVNKKSTKVNKKPTSLAQYPPNFIMSILCLCYVRLMSILCPLTFQVNLTVM